MSMQFRYADFVSTLGGTEEQLGMITGIGMVGAIVARCFQGVAIDRYGTGRVWIFSLGLLVVCLLGHLFVDSLQPPTIHLLRITYTISLAGAFGASITFVSLRAPPSRMGEMIGMLGSSGFVGMGIGPWIGDLLFAGPESEIISRLFTCSAVAAGVALFLAIAASSGSEAAGPPGESEATPVNPIPLVRRYHPGWTLLIGLAMGVGIGLPGTFVSAFAAEKQIANIAWYWTPYSVMAFVVRVFTRRLADRWGTRPTALTGFGCIAASMLAYLLVNNGQTLIIPAVLGGMAHAFLFPAVMSEGNQSFPVEYRGLATNVMLAMFDIGMLFGQPIFGWTVEFARARGADGYAVAFSGMAATTLLVAAVYAILQTTIKVVRRPARELN